MISGSSCSDTLEWLMVLFEIGIVDVPFGNDLRLFRPGYAECRIVPPYSPGGFRVIEFRHLVKNLAALLQGQKTVSASLRDVKHVAVPGSQNDGSPLLEGRRLGPQV